MIEQTTLMADASFMKSRVILTSAELDLFSQLHKDQASAQELAEAMGLDLRATTRLLDCLVTFDLLDKHNDRYRTTALGSLLSSYHPETVLPMVLHTNHLWDSWSDLTDIVRKGTRTERRTRTGSQMTQKAFIDAMHVVAKTISKEITSAYDVSPFVRFMDIGGGSGSYTIAFLKRNPRMTAVLFDLDGVISMARERLTAEGLGERVDLVAGDFNRDELPSGCDLALLSAIIHQNSPEENLTLYQKIHKALLPGGVLLIRDHIMEESRTSPRAGALFALNMLVNTPAGDTYTFGEVREGLEKAGFGNIELVRTGERMDCLVEARKSR